MVGRGLEEVSALAVLPLQSHTFKRSTVALSVYDLARARTSSAAPQHKTSLAPCSHLRPSGGCVDLPLGRPEHVH